MDISTLTNNAIGDCEIFPWNENFNTGLPLIDEQHKKLVQLLNQLASHLAYQSDMPTLNTIFCELTAYAGYHFQTEEAIWHEFCVEDELALAHQRTHQQFSSELSTLRNSPHNLQQVIEAVLSFLTHWLAFHILDSDKRMAKIVLAIQAGLSIEQAKQQSENEMSGALKVLIDCILSMYDNLSMRTLSLMREMVEKQKFEKKQRLASNVFENTLDAICITDPQFIVIDANPVFYQTTSYALSDVIGKNLITLKPGLEDVSIVNCLWQTLDKQGHWSGKVASRDRTGSLNAEWLTLSAVKDEQQQITNYVGVFSNISHFIQQQHHLEHIAHHDVLTDLPNRLLLFDRLEMAITYAKRQQRLLAICYLDLDGFKPVNDNFGHIVGDQVLQRIAKRLLKSVRNSDTVARLGGDEFVILLNDFDKIDDCENLLNRILHEIARPIQLKNTLTKVTASVGVTLFPQDESAPELLIHHADQAMYQAKKTGKSKYCFY